MFRTTDQQTVPRWLDIDSTHRLRALYPSPTEFTVPINVGDAGVINDPIQSSAPWTASTNPIGSNFTQTSVDATHITLDPGEPSVHGFYSDTTLEINGEDHTILDYDGDTKVATVDTAFSFLPAPETAYIIRKVKSFFRSVVAIGPVDPRTGTVSSVNMIQASPSLTPNIYATDFMAFVNGNHANSNTPNSQVVVEYNPQPLNAAFSQPFHQGESQWVSTSPQGLVFTSAFTGAIKTLMLSLRCCSSTSNSRLLQIQIATQNGSTILTSNLVSVTPSTTPSDVIYSLGQSNVTVNLTANTSYLLTLQDMTAGGNSTGWIEMFGVVNPTNPTGKVPSFFQVIPRYQLIVAGLGGSSQFSYQQTINAASTEWISPGNNQAFVFTTPGDTNTVHTAMTGSALFTAFDGGNSSRTITTSMYRGNLIQGGTVSNPPPTSLVYTTTNTFDMTSNAYTYAPVSVNNNQQLVPNEVTLGISGGTTGMGMPFNISQTVNVAPTTTLTAHTGITNVWHFGMSVATISTSPADYGHFSSGFSTPNNLQNNAIQAQAIVTGFVNGTAFVPSVTFQAWWNDPGFYQVVLSPKTVVATLGTSTNGGATSPYTAVFTYNTAECSNVQFTQLMDLIVGYNFDSGAGTSTYSNNKINWVLTYPAAATGGGIPIQGGTTYTFLWNDQTPGGNDTGFTNFLGALATSVSLSSFCTTTVFPWVNFQDPFTNIVFFGQTFTDPWAFQGMMPDGHEIGYWFQPSVTLQLLTVTIALFVYQENAGQRYIQAQLRQGNANDLSGPVLESIGTLTVLTGQTGDGTTPAQVTFTFSGATLLSASQTYTFTMTDSTGDGNSTGGVYVYGVQDDVSAVGWDQGGLSAWDHPWISAQMSVFSGQLILETASQQLNQDLTGLYTLDTAASLVIPFDITLGNEGFIQAFGFLGTSFGNRIVQVSLFGPTVSQLLFQGDFQLADSGSSLFSTTSASQLLTYIGVQNVLLQVNAQIQTYTIAFLDVTPTNQSTTSGVFMYGLAGPLPSPELSVIVPIFTLSYGPPQALSSFLGSFQDVVEFSPSTTDNLSVLHTGGTVVTSTGKQLQSGWFYVVLDWLIIPKQIMSVGIGGLLTNYPYLYVILTNSGANSALNLIHSNNKFMDSRAVFPVEISSWLYSADPKSFYTLKPHNAESRPQLMQLRLDQSISFSLQLPSGQTVAWSTADNMSPSPINPLLQISASLKLLPV